MNRVHLVPAALPLLFLLASCGGETPAIDPSVNGAPTEEPEALPSDSPCEAITITDLTAPETLLYNTNNISPQLGSEVADLFWIELYDDVTGVLAVGDGVDDNYKTCDHCLLIAEDSPTGDLVEATRLYYATSGTMEISEASVPTEGVLDATLSEVVFKEVTIDRANTGFLTTEVSGGRCLRLEQATFSARLQ